MGVRGPIPTHWSTETARGRNTYYATGEALPPEPDVSPPGWLAPDALAVWMEQAPALIKSGRLRSSCQAEFAIRCQLAADCESLSREVAAEGAVVDSPRGPKANPKVRLLRDARRDLLQYAKAFALDPASAARMPAKAPEQAAANPLLAYIEARKK